MQVVALDLIAIVVHRHLGADQADVADVMLRAGMVAAGEMDVDRRIEREARARCGRRCRRAWPLVSDGGELAAAIARAGDQAGAQRVDRRCARPSASMAALAASTFARRRPEMSRFCQTVSRMSPSPNVARDVGQRRASASQVSLPSRQHDADPVQPGCFCAMHADMRHDDRRRGAA